VWLPGSDKLTGFAMHADKQSDVVAGPAFSVVEKRLPWSLCAGMAVQFAAGGAVIPFVSLVLRDRGLDFSRISLVFSAASATLLVSPFLWGMLADRYVPLNRLFIALNLLAGAALAIFAAQTEFLGCLLAYTFFFGFFNPTLTLINALSFHHFTNPREQFGIVRAWGSFGWIVPFLPISLWLMNPRHTGLNIVLYLGMGFCFAMAVLSFWLPHTPPGAGKRSLGTTAPRAYGPAVKKLLRDPNYVVVLVSMFLMSGSFSVLMYYSLPYLEDIGVPRVWLGAIQSIGVLCEIVFFLWQPALIRRWNYTTSILLGCVALLLRHLLFSTLDNAWILSASYLLAGGVIVFYYIGVSVLVNAMAAIEVRATAQTLLVLFGSGMGPMFANWMVGHVALPGKSLRPVFLFAAALAGLATLLIAARGRQLNHAGKP
jgi:MFS family permease